MSTGTKKWLTAVRSGSEKCFQDVKKNTKGCDEEKGVKIDVEG